VYCLAAWCGALRSTAAFAGGGLLCTPPQGTVPRFSGLHGETRENVPVVVCSCLLLPCGSKPPPYIETSPLR